MIVLVTQGEKIVIVANETESIPTRLLGLAELVIRGSRVIKNNW